MEHTMYGFAYDYIRYRGTRLVLSRVEPLGRDELQRIELRMLEGNAIPGHLPFESEEIDLQIRLLYDITGKRMLSQWMMTGKCTLQEYYRFLLNCAVTIDDSRAYMLREDGYWLHEDFIFVPGDVSEQPELLYVPVALNEVKPSAAEQFRGLAMRLSASIDRIEGSGFSALLSMLRGEHYSFREVRELLGTLLQPNVASGNIREADTSIGLGTGPDTDSEVGTAITTAAGPSASFEGTAPARTVPEWLHAGLFARQERSLDTENQGRRSLTAAGTGSHNGVLPERGRLFGSGSQTLSAEAGQKREASAEAEAEVAADQTSRAEQPLRQRLLLCAAGLAGLFLLWSFYPDSAPEGAFAVWSGLTVFMLDAVFVATALRGRAGASGRGNWNWNGSGSKNGGDDPGAGAGHRESSAGQAAENAGASSAFGRIASRIRDSDKVTAAGYANSSSFAQSEQGTASRERASIGGAAGGRTARESATGERASGESTTGERASGVRVSGDTDSSRRSGASPWASAIASIQASEATGVDPVRAARMARMTQAGNEDADEEEKQTETVIGPASYPAHRARDATVLLHPMRAGTEEGETDACPSLEMRKGEAIERLPLRADRFLIGRDAAAVDFTDDTVGVSKLHVEIARKDNGYFAKDLGSRNGTLWNDEMMVPYKWYPLEDGTRLQIVQTRFKFQASGAQPLRHH